MPAMRAAGGTATAGATAAATRLGPTLRCHANTGRQVVQNRRPCAVRVHQAAQEGGAAWEELVAAVASGPTLVAAGPTPLGRGLAATRDVTPGEAIVSVPLSNALAVSDEPGGAFGRAALAEWQEAHGQLPPLLAGFLLGSSRADWFLRLTAWLLWVSRHGRGPWRLYAGLLPGEGEMTCLMNYRDEELGELQSPALEALAKKERAAILGVHDLVFGSSMGELKALRLAESPNDTVWAACCVNSRCFSEQVDGEQVSLVVPCADMANHLPTPNASYRFSTEARMFQLLAEAPIACGSEACISYHHGKSNEELFRDSGFIIPGNPLDRIKFGSKAASAAQFGALLRAASSGAMSGSGGVAGGAGSPASSGGPPERGLDLRRLMRALQIPSRVRDGRLELPAVPATPDQGRRTAVLLSLQAHLRTGLSPAASSGGGGSCGSGAGAEAELQQERRCAEELLEEARQMLAGHGTSAATDEALLAGADGVLSLRRRQAIASRLERKRLLQTAIDVFEGYAASLE